MPFAAALSQHPLATHATGEVVGRVLEILGTEPDVVIVFVSVAHLGSLEDIATTIRVTLSPKALIGVTSHSVLGGPYEAEGQAAISIWAARHSPVVPIRISGSPIEDTIAYSGLPDTASIPGSTLILLADPYSFPIGPFLNGITHQLPDLQVIGGFASAAQGPGGNRLACDGEVSTDGAVGLLFGPEWPITASVSQGCRPIGDPFTVTGAERSMVSQIAGVTALTKIERVVGELDPADRNIATQGLYLGRLVDDHNIEPGRGDFLVRSIRGVDRTTGAIAVSDTVAVGDTVQFHVRDATTCGEDLDHMLADAAKDDPPVASALLFTCTGRGARLFDEPDHDAATVSEIVGPAVAGMFCAGEIGPIGSRPFVHSLTATMALFRE